MHWLHHCKVRHVDCSLQSAGQKGVGGELGRQRLCNYGVSSFMVDSTAYLGVFGKQVKVKSLLGKVGSLWPPARR
jgi:hypothetical protein